MVSLEGFISFKGEYNIKEENISTKVSKEEIYDDRIKRKV